MKLHQVKFRNMDAHLKSTNSITVMKQLEEDRVTAAEAPPDRGLVTNFVNLITNLEI